MAEANSRALKFSWISQASYRDFQGLSRGDTPGLLSRLTEGSFATDKQFSAIQAIDFSTQASGYAFVSQLPNTSNGTSLTIFKSNEATNNSYTIAVRGTEPTGQLLADLQQDLFGVVFSGKAKVQLIEAFRYYKRATTPGGARVIYSNQEKAAMARVLMSGTIWAPASAVQTVFAAISVFNALTASDEGLGPVGETLIPSRAVVNFTGHSLGGHVAYLLAQLVQSTASGSRTVGDVMTYNAPGENALRYEVLNWLGIDTSSPAGAIGSKHLAFYGEGGLNVTAGLGQVIGTRRPIFIEREADGYGSDGGTLPNHSIVKLGDSLALYDLFALLDDKVTEKSINNILSASANKGLNSLEAGLDALRKLLLGAGVTPTKMTGATEDRERYYANLMELRDAIQQRGLAGQFIVRDLPNSSVMLEKARNSGLDTLAYRYALKELNPFVLLAPASVYEAQNANGELTLYNAATGTGSLTEAWLADRAAFLSWKNQINTKDVADDDSLRRTDGGEDSLLFVDRTLKNNSGQDYKVRVLGENLSRRTDPVQILFGNDADDAWTGSHFADHLYGEGGDDQLAGGVGDDYLEGGKGNDRLSGDEGNDILIGGAGNDTLLAGEGSNRLEGGIGFDTYDVSSGTLQLIVDADGTGKVILDGLELTGGARVSANRYANDDKSVTYTFVGDLTTGGVLEISGGVSIRGFHDGDLGIHLVDEAAPASPRTPGRFVVSDDDKPDDINDRIEIAHVHILDANGGDGLWIYDNIEVRSGIGNDIVTTTGNNVYMNGGAGNDYLGASSWTNQSGVTIVGGSGTDLIHGGTGAEKIYGEEEKAFNLALEAGASDDGSGLIGDWLSGGGGDDLIVGGAGDDIVYGGAGNNTILGGAGNDHLYGDELAVTDLIYSRDGVYDIELPYGFEFQWSFRQTLMLRNDRRQEVPTNASDPFTPQGWGNNTIYAGNGDDWVSGGYGDDYIDGGSGNDTLNGDNGANVILGGDGNDAIFSGNYGEESNGYLDGGEGDDRIVGTNGVYLVEGGAGDDFIWVDIASPLIQGNVIYAGDGDDTVLGSFGSDYVEGGDGNDIIHGNGGDDFILGGPGEDHIEIGEGVFQVYGEAGDDVLFITEGFSGSVLSGGAGNDEYAFIAGSGDVTLKDDEGNNRIVFLYGEELEDVEILDPLAMWIEWNGPEKALVYGNDGIRIGLDVGSNLPSIVVRHVTEYVDGHWIGNDELIDWDSLELGQFGTDEADFIEAYPGGANTLAGYAGNDYIIGAIGNDTLSGGSGDDLLDGGAGSDLYLIGFDEGHDTVADSGISPSDINVLRFGAGISTADISILQNYDDLRLQIGEEAAGNSVTIAGAGIRDVIARVEFVDGTKWSASTLRSVAVLVSEPAWELPVEPPPLTEGVDGPGDAGGRDAPVSTDAGRNHEAASVTGEEDGGPIVFEPPFSFPTLTVTPANPSQFSNPNPVVTEFPAPVFEPEPTAIAFGSFAAPTESFGGVSLGAGLGGGPVAVPSIVLPIVTQPITSVAARGTSLPSAPANEAPPGRVDQVTSRTRDAGSSSSTTDTANADGSPAPTDESTSVTQPTRRDPEPGGIGWLAQQSDAPHETAPALTQWAIANALLQFRLASIDESAAANSSAGFINSPIAGLPGLSDMGPLGMGTGGLGSEGARLQSFSGLNEGLAALAA